MGRKGKFSKLLLFAAMLSTIGAGVFGSVPLPVKAAEEENYTVTFEAYEGNCETESVSVPKGESIILPDASYEGHYLEGWVDVVESEGVTTFKTIGAAGSEYTPEGDLWLYANWKPNQEQDITVTYEARIGDTGYEELEEAFANAQAGDTIIVLKDCSVSTTLEITAGNITLKSEDAGNPVTISRSEGFSVKSYGLNTDTVLIAVKGGSLSTQDIILDGGAVLDEDFSNSGKVWNSPLVYVDGFYAMESGTVLQNNYNTDGDDGSSGGRTRHTAGAVHIADNGSLTMDGSLIQNCYSAGGGGGVQSGWGSHVSAASGTVRNCYATWGGGMDLLGSAELSGMAFTGNAAGSSGGAVSSADSLTVTDCLIEGNRSAYDGGGIYTGTGHQAVISGCTITGNTAGRGSAIQTVKGAGELPLIIRDCTITGNRSMERTSMGSAVCYMNETGIILDGNIVMEDNLAVGISPCDIFYFYNEGASILLDENFESTSTFVLGGYDNIKPGRVLVDGTLYHKDAGPEQFVWNTKKYCTEKRGENLYLAEITETEASITFDADGGKMEGGSITAKKGDTILLPSCMKEGYDFTGWYDNDTCVGQAGEAYTVSGDVTLKAHYEKKAKTVCTVSFDTDGGKEVASMEAVKGETIKLPEAEKEKHIFLGWYTEKVGGSLTGAAGDEIEVTEDITLYARWQKENEEPDEGKEVTVTFDADGGETARESITAKKGSMIILPASSRTGWEFLGWFLASDDSICIGQAGEGFTVQEDTALKAHYEKKEAVKVTIIFNTDGGKEVNPIKASKGEIIRLPKTEKEGYCFLGWYTEKDGGILLGIPGSEMKAAKDMTAYALWEKEEAKNDDSDKDTAPDTCNVLFHAGKGTIKVKELTIIKDGSLYLPLPEHEGYDFAGWYLDDDLTQFAGAYRDTYRIIRDTDFYAKWEKTTGSSGNNGDSENSGNTGDESGNGSGSGGNGSGVGNNGGTQDGDGSGETLNTYTIKYDANGGKTKNASVKVVKGASVKLPTAEREGYIFKGWYTDRQVFIGTEGETYKPGRSISLYARWEKEEGENNKDNSNNSSGKENSSDKNSKDTSDKNQNTGGTVSGNTVGSPSDKNTDTRTEGGNGNAGKGTEPVIQTGHVSPLYLLAALGLCGVMLAAASALEGKSLSLKDRQERKSCL